MENSGKRGLLLTVLMTVLLLISLSLLFWKMSGVELRRGEFWRNYYTVITTDPSIAETALEKQSIPFLSLSRSTVYFNAVPEMENLRLEDLSGRFDPADPRMDPYMREAGKLFSGFSGEDEKELLYVEADAVNLFSLHRLLDNAYSEVDESWSISGFDSSSYLHPLILYGISALLLSILFISSLPRLLPALLSWLPLLFFGGYPLVAAAIVSLYTASLRKNPLIVFLTTAVSVLLLIFLGQLAPREAALYITPLIPAFFLLSGNPGKSTVKKMKKSKVKRNRPRRRIRFSRPEHNLFEPVSIMASTPKVQKVSLLEKRDAVPLWGKIASIIMILLSAFLTFSENPMESHTLPLPSGAGEGEWTLEDTGRTFGKGNFVSPGDYVAHMAYQEGFLYKREWEYPRSEEPLSFPRFEKEDEGFSKNYEIMENYSGKWFQDRFFLLKNNNPAKLLFSTEYPSTVEKKSDQPIYHSFLLLKFSFFMLVLLLLFFSNREKAEILYKSARKKLLRRNEQVA